MKLFQFVQKQFAILGIIPNQQQQPFNLKIRMVFVCYWTTNISNVLILIFKAKGFNEYTNSTFITSATTTVAICYTILILNMAKLFEFIEFSEEITVCGESNFTYKLKISIEIRFLCGIIKKL